MSEREQVEAAKNRLKDVYPDWHVFYGFFTDKWFVHENTKDGNKCIGSGASEDAAILDAASRLPAPVSQPVAKEFSYFRCLSCGYSGTITEEEIAKHRERCAHGPTVAVDPSPQAEPSESAGAKECVTNGNYCKTHDCFSATCKEFRSKEPFQPSTLPQSSQQAQGFEQDVLDALVILKHERAGDITGHHYARLVDQYRQRFGKKEQ